MLPLLREYWSRFYKGCYYFFCGGDCRGVVAAQVYDRLADYSFGPIKQAQAKAYGHYSPIHLEPWGADVEAIWHNKIVRMRERMVHGGVGPWVRRRFSFVESGIREQLWNFRSGQ